MGRPWLTLGEVMDVLGRTLFTLRWFKNPALRQIVTSRAQQGRGAQQPRARGRVPQAGPVPRPRAGEPATPLPRSPSSPRRSSCSTAAISAAPSPNFSAAGNPLAPALLPPLSPLGWDRINPTGDHVSSDRIEVDDQGLTPLLAPER